MALIKCPECGRESVSEFAEICPECGFAIRDYFEMHNVDKILINEPSEDETEMLEVSKKKNSKIGVIVAIVAIIVLVSYYGYSSTRCAYSGCHSPKSGSSKYCSYHEGVLNYLYSNSYRDNSYGSSRYNNSNKSTMDLKISDVRVYTNSVSTYCTGTITNNGDDTFSFVQIKGSFKDKEGNTVETGNSYAVGQEGLEPGESTSFSIYCDRNNSVKTCDVSIFDYD